MLTPKGVLSMATGRSKAKPRVTELTNAVATSQPNVATELEIKC